MSDTVVQPTMSRDPSEQVTTLNLWLRLAKYARRYPVEVSILAFAAVVSGFLEIGFPLITKWVIDDVSANGVDADFFFWAVLYAGTTVLLALALVVFVYAASRLRANLSHDIRQDAYNNLLRLSFSYYDTRSVGWIMARLTSDCERLTNIMAWAILDIAWGVTLMVVVGGAMLFLHWQLGLLVLALIPLMIFVSIRFSILLLGTARAVRRTNSRLTGAFNEGIMGVVTSKTFAREESNLVGFRRLTGRMYGFSVHNLTLAAVYVPILSVLSSVAVGLALAMGGTAMESGAIAIGTVVAFMVLVRLFIEPVEILGEWYAEIQMARAAAERIFGVIDEVPSIKDGPSVLGDSENEAVQGVIDRVELVNVNFAYPTGDDVLQSVDLSVARGETVALVGPTGGGKSTLVNLVCRFYEPTAGQVLINGVDYRDVRLHWYRSKIGVVLQQSHILRGSIRENILYGNLQATDDQIEEAARVAGAHSFISELPGSYGFEVGEQGERLSAGQKQLVSIARAVLSNSEIMILDEATSSIDGETERQIQEGIQMLLSGRISFVIAHRLSTIRNADQILYIEEGRVVERGRHAELLALDARYAKLYRQQSIEERMREDYGLNESIESD